MPIFLIFAGVLLLAAGINDKTTELTGLLKGDFAPRDGKPGFVTWVFAIFVVGALGYFKPLKPVSTAFLLLIFVVMFLTNGKGFFAKITGLLSGVNANPNSPLIGQQYSLYNPPVGGGSFGGAGATGSF